MLLGASCWTDQECFEEDTVTLPSLQTLVVEIEADLNNQSSTYVTSELTSHILYGRMIDTVPHSLTTGDKIVDDNFKPNYK